ncbi:MAG: ABC transporter ATP-binding protein/permease [candidate division KSB1 bacterium]|nr:ABC transporter ATP-binding protein/permease [candidate division KSB1 bacterium]MDZ7276117.1 ABC transporter ATP-binding protein/permease [candidate division KSB1 bacterium]MDZ7287103.1 ABC transporter ATP-binding protein/permease [candidate division KSB1 bacterium]MDZ7296972.1 ABC transporter ATP-binding protein/permease [candidate division KSB1 bacterium]MDZ7306199.1 ABC transporter ATP-binding protein/permease [candidate division KSB1 bacterium]
MSSNRESRPIWQQQAWRIDRALRLVWQCSRGWTLAGLALMLLQSLMPLLSLYLTKQILDAVTQAITGASRSAALRQVFLWVGWAAAATLFSEVLRALGSFVSQAQAQVVADHIHQRLHRKSVALDLAYYENPRYYDTLHRAQEDAPFRPLSIVTGLLQAGQSGLSLLALAGLLFAFHPLLAAILFAATLPGLMVRVKYARETFRRQQRWTANERRAYSYHWLLTAGEFAGEIRLFHLGPLFISRFRELRAHIRRERLALSRQAMLAELGPQALAILAVFGAVTLLVKQAFAGALTPGALVMYWQAFQRGQENFRDLLHAAAGIYQDNLFLASFHEFLELQPAITTPARPRPLPRPLKTGIEFHCVSFCYPGTSRTALHDISLRLRPGEIVALVGENGSGKSTLIKLLCRLYDPTAGRITLDGVDLREYDPAAWRAEIGVLFQDYVRYNLSARENIWLGEITLAPDDQRIAAVARQTGADRVIAKLPAGPATLLGKWFEEGEELSTGEWQKLALSRACLRQKQLLLLDEPTSSLDARAEAQFFQHLRAIAADRATLLISHRLATARLADRIYVLANGHLVASGTHAQLLSQSGNYAELFATQAQSYRTGEAVTA